MKRTDAIHIPGAFHLDTAPRLPLTGELHPLKREFTKWLGWANGAALIAGLLGFALWFVWSSTRREAAPVMREVRIVRYTELGVPPSISKQAATAPQIKIAEAVAPPSIGVPQPVPDIQAAPRATIATQEQMATALGPVTVGQLGGTGTGDSLVVQGPGGGTGTGEEQEPSPDEFIAVEQDPVRIKIDPPVYPEVAKSAGVEGTVIVRALVGKDGHVKKCLIVDGHEMLNDAAIACAKTALFKPALLQNKPVEVWVLMPIVFKFLK